MPDPSIEIETGPTPNAAVIWLHGLGADGNDFVPIVPELKLPEDLSIRFIFPHAEIRPVTCNGGMEMRAWYDIYSLDNFSREDSAGFEESRIIIHKIIQQQVACGINSQRIILMGFSQGGAVALHAGLQCPETLAGIGALSTYLPLHQSAQKNAHPANRHTSIFMAHGNNDPVVLYRFGKASYEQLVKMQYDVTWKQYPMEHSVCAEEITDISDWIKRCLSVE